jgi:hypothetical protein
MFDRIDADAPAGYQAVEFLDIPPMDESLTDPPDPHWGGRRSVRLDAQIRSRLTSSARAYIEDLVESYDGDVDDVRSVIGALDAG